MSANEASTDGLIGYLPESEQSDVTTALFCADSQFSASSFVGTCCPSTGNCRIPTTCLANTLWFTAGNQRCGPGRTCATLTIYESAEDAQNQELTLQYHCQETVTGSEYHTVYRENPVQETETSTAKTSSREDGASTSTPNNDDSTGSSSKAWIAGAVIGPLVFFLLCVLTYWIWRRRRAIKPRQKHQSAEVNGSEGKPELPGSTVTGAALAGSGANGWDKPELGGAERYEVQGNNMASYGRTGSELSGSGEIGASNTADRHELHGNESFYQELQGESAKAEPHTGSHLAS